LISRHAGDPWLTRLEEDLIPSLPQEAWDSAIWLLLAFLLHSVDGSVGSGGNKPGPARWEAKSALKPLKNAEASLYRRFPRLTRRRRGD
jgi:hypothetical protein